MDRSQENGVRFRVSSDLLPEQLPGGESVFLHLGSEEYFGLDEVGTRCWGVLSATGSVEAAHRQLLEEYDVEPNRLRHDLGDFVEDLLRHGFIERHDQ